MGSQDIPNSHHDNIRSVYAQLTLEIGEDRIDYSIKRPTPNLQQPIYFCLVQGIIIVSFQQYMNERQIFFGYLY